MMYVTGHSILTSSRLGGYPPLSFLGANDLLEYLVVDDSHHISKNSFKTAQCYTVYIHVNVKTNLQFDEKYFRTEKFPDLWYMLITIYIL